MIEEPIPFHIWLMNGLRGLWPRRRPVSPRRPPWRSRTRLPIIFAPGAFKSIGWTTDEYERVFGGLSAGMRDRFTSASPVDLADTFAASTWVYAATTTRAQAVADVPLKAVDANHEPVPAWHRLASLFPDSLLWTLEADLCLTGTALLVKLVNEHGVVTELQRINPKKFKVDSTEREGLRGFELDGYYEVGGQRMAYLVPNQVVYIHLYDPNDDFGAVAPAEVALVRAGTERSIMEYALSYFANNGVPGALFMPPDNPDMTADYEEAAPELELTLREMFKGVRNAFRAGVLPHRWHVWQAQQTPDGVALPALSDEIKVSILTVFGMAESILTSGASNYAEAQSDRLNFYQNAIRPRCKFIATQLTRQLVHPDFGEQWTLTPDFSEVPAMQADKADRVAVVNAQVTGGYMTLNEARAETYLPADPRFDDYVVIQGVPVHLSRLPDLYKALLPEPGGLFGAPVIRALPAEVPPAPSEPAFSWTPAGAEAAVADLVRWQRAALKGAAYTPTNVPARIALPLHGRLVDADADFTIRAAFDPAFAAAKAEQDQAFNLDRWWDEYAEREAEAIDGFMGLWRRMAAAMVEALQSLPHNASAEAVNAALARVIARYTGEHPKLIEPLAREVFNAGVALGSDQVDHLLASQTSKAYAWKLSQPSLGILWDLVNKAAVEYARQTAGARVTEVNATTRQRVRDLVTRRMAGGMTHEELIEDLMQVVEGAPGEDNVFYPVFGQWRAELIAQTESTLALDGGQETAWRTRGVPMSTWHTAADGYVCALCRALHGKSAPLDGAFPIDPEALALLDKGQRARARRGIKRPGLDTHPGCRCLRRPAGVIEVPEPSSGVVQLELPLGGQVTRAAGSIYDDLPEALAKLREIVAPAEAPRPAITAATRGRAVIYEMPDVPESELQVVLRDDGRRAVATFHIPSEQRGQGLGQHMLLRALMDGPIAVESFGGVSDAYRGVQDALVEKGLAEVVEDEYGVKLLRLKA